MHACLSMCLLLAPCYTYILGHTPLDHGLCFVGFGIGFDTGLLAGWCVCILECVGIRDDCRLLEPCGTLVARLLLLLLSRQLGVYALVVLPSPAPCCAVLCCACELQPVLSCCLVQAPGSSWHLGVTNPASREGAVLLCTCRSMSPLPPQQPLTNLW